jgi:hypothetical protein
MPTLPALPTTDIVTRAAVVEGYNSNTYQAQDSPALPIISRHPSPFTGIDANLELRFPGRDNDRTSLVVGARANHYEPLQHQNQSDDGALNLALASVATLAPRTTMSITDTGSVTSFNGAHMTDGTIFAFDPTQVRSTYWVNDANVGIVRLLSPTWRLGLSIGGLISGTIQSPPTLMAGGRFVEHRGLDYVTPYAEADLDKDYNERTSGSLMLLYQYAYQLFVLDYTQTPPRNIGPNKQAYLTGLAGITRHFSPEVSCVLRLGGVLASAPPRDIDQRAVLSPAGTAELYYTRPLFDLVATAGYTWGSINPRLGDGPNATAGLLAIGVPHPVGPWRDFALIGRANAAYSVLITGVSQSSTLGLYAAGFEARYGLNRWLGVLAGYDVRYATFDTASFMPPFFQQVVFVGLSGFWATDRSQLPLTTFTAPVMPPS